MLVEAYERTHFPIAPPDPLDFLRDVMETRGLPATVLIQDYPLRRDAA